MPGPSPPGLNERKYRVERKDWGDNRRLDLDIAPEGFVAWRERALGHLSMDRPDVRKLLLWAETRTLVIDDKEEKTGAAAVGLRDDPEHVSYVLFEASRASCPMHSCPAPGLVGTVVAWSSGTGSTPSGKAAPRR
jgi:hypothetical protein